MSNISAVVLGANYYVGLSVARCLGRNRARVAAARIEGHERVQYGLMSKYVREILDLPSITAAPDQAVQKLVEYGSRQQTKPVLMPTADVYLLFMEEYKAQLRDYYLFPQVEDGLFKKLVDKDLLSVLAKEWQVPIPTTLLPQEFNEDFSAIGNLIGYPCLVKPVNSFKFTPIFKCKLLLVNNEAELVKALNLAKEKGLEVFIQQHIKGHDSNMHTYDCYINKEGVITHWATCQKQRQFPINFGASTFIKTKYVPELHEIGSRFLTGVGYRGFAEIEFKQDAETGKFYMIEVNARITNFNALLEKAGMNIPMLLAADLTDGDYCCGPVVYNGLHFCSGYEDFAAIRAYIKAKQLTVPDALKSMLNKKVFSIWSIDDPKPFLRFATEKIFGSIKKRISKKQLTTAIES